MSRKFWLKRHRGARQATPLACAASIVVIGVASTGAWAARPQSNATANPAWNVYSAPQRLVRLPDGRAINLYCLGQGSPTVILDAGLGGSSLDWRKVHSRLAQMSQVCAFDRAGSGFSDPGPLPRDTAHIAQDMKATFEAAGLKPPYVLVGHSLAGLDVRYYSDLHPQEVAGLVLVDSSTEHQTKRLVEAIPALQPLFDQQRAGIQACLDRLEGRAQPKADLDEACKEQPLPDLPAAVNTVLATLDSKPYHLQSVLSELDAALGSSADEVPARRPYGALPLIVLTAGAPVIPLPPADLETWVKMFKQMHREVAALSTHGVERTVPGSGHYIQLDKPQAVIDAVSEVLAEVRAGKAGAKREHH